MMPGRPRRMMHQSKPGVRRRRVSHPSIHFPRSVYLPSTNTGALGFNKFSLGAKKSSLAITTAPPSRSDARSISSVKSMDLIRVYPRKTAVKNILTMACDPRVIQQSNQTHKSFASGGNIFALHRSAARDCKAKFYGDVGLM